MREAAGSLRMSLISNSLESPFNKGGLTSNMETGPAGFATLYPPYRWIPVPRFHEDKLRGNDTRMGKAPHACPNRVQGRVPVGVWGVPRSPNLPPRMGDQRGLTRRVWSQFRIEAR